MNTKLKAENTVLLNGDEVPKRFYDALLDQALVNRPKTIVGNVYVAEKIIGTDYWVKQIFKEDRTMAGRCIKDMAGRGLIPYTFVERLTNNSSAYRRM